MKLALVIALASCAGPAEVRYVPVVSRCALPDPPVNRAHTVMVGGEGACPASVAACLDADTAVDLALYVDALERYAREARALCAHALDGGL